MNHMLSLILREFEILHLPPFYLSPASILSFSKWKTGIAMIQHDLFHHEAARTWFYLERPVLNICVAQVGRR